MSGPYMGFWTALQNLIEACTMFVKEENRRRNAAA